MAKLRNVDHFDPSDQETVELVTPDKTPESAWNEDTNADPVGVEERNAPQAIQLPDYYFRKYAIDSEGKPCFVKSRVEGIMNVFESKKNSTWNDVLAQRETLDDEARKKELDYFSNQVATAADGLQPLLETDPQSTGINFLQLTTRTWAEFSSIAFEYQDEAAAYPSQMDMPDWLVQREEKMFDLGRKARLCSAVVAATGNAFGLNDLMLNSFRIQAEVERRQQRLAEWNFKNSVDTSVKQNKDLNKLTQQHTQNMFSAA